MMPRRFRFWHRALSAMLGLLLSISIVGQQLPCVHAVAPLASASLAGSDPAPAVPTTAAPTATDHAAMHHDHHAVAVTPDKSGQSQSPASAPHHDPAAPGCAQLMACGLAVQVTTANTLSVDDLAMSTAEPIGEYLQFSTADLEVESPPPKG